jgi:hypothetical protein
MNAISKAVVLSACVIALAACGSDDKEETPAGAGGSGGSSGSSGAGDGGTAGGGTGGTAGGGTGGTGGTGGMMAEPVVCGGETCATPSNNRLRACCVEDTDVCGEMIIGGFFGRCAVPVEPHPDCESASIMSFTVPSCCTTEGRCGISFAQVFMEPCTSIEDLLALAADAGAGEGDGGAADGGAADGGGGISFGENVPDPAPCTP